jgi:hypothetical protein
MKTFKEITEAKVTRNLTDTYPAAKGEQHFVDRHIKFDILKRFRQPGNDNMFNGKVVKIFPRKENHYGNDMNQSIIQYDENLKSDRKHHIFIDGKWVGTTSWAKTNKDALHSFKKDHPDIKTKVNVAFNREDDK